MAQRGLPGFVLVAALISALIAQVLRGEEPAAKSAADPPAKSSEAKSSDQSDLRIKEAYGTKDYHLGMPRNAFGKDWEPHWKRPDEEGYLINRKEGVAALFADRRVIGVNFNYLNRPQWSPYGNNTEKGIGQSSSILEVQSAYGEPSHIDVTWGDHDSPSMLDVIYEELGIEFTFSDGKLATVSVKTPIKNLDYDHYRRSMNQFLIYIRQPGKR